MILSYCFLISGNARLWLTFINEILDYNDFLLVFSYKLFGAFIKKLSEIQKDFMILKKNT